MALKTHLRRKQQRKVRGNATQPFFQQKGNEHTEMTESSSFFAPANTKVQTKLTVNQPGDVHEQEADRMAEKVVSAPTTAMLGVQRAEQKEEEKVSRKGKEEEVHKKEEKEPKVQTKKEEEVQRAETRKEEEVHKKEEEEKVATKVTGNAPPTVSTSTAQNIQNSKSAGSTLPKQTMHEMSNAFGYDFSKVRIHTDSQSERMNNDLQAQAFTNGKDIYFNEGKYNPQTTEGKKLLAHELTHVVQQGGIQTRSTLQRDPVAADVAIDAPIDIFESETKIVLVPIEVQDKGLTYSRSASLELSLSLQVPADNKIGKFSFSFLKPEISAALKLAKENKGTANVNYTVGLEGGASLTLVEAKLKGSLFLPKDSKIKFSVDGGFEFSVDDQGKLELKPTLKPKVKLEIPLSKGVNVQGWGVPGGGGLSIEFTF